MNILKNKGSTWSAKNIISYVLAASTLSACCLLSSSVSFANANDTSSLRSLNVSYEGHLTAAKQSRFAMGQNNAQQVTLDKINLLGISPLERNTREQNIAQRQLEFATKSKSTGALLQNKSASYAGTSEYITFDIYSASSRLFEDKDYDGFYRTFSVTFDADVYSPYTGQRAKVFADLYLSHNGGPWELYFTTEPFIITDDNSDDEYEVLTTLDTGFSAQYYDVLIDVYELGYSDIVATISSDNVDALYALPLESAERDHYESAGYSTSIGIAGGSTSFYSVFTLGLISLLRVIYKKRCWMNHDF